MEWNGGASTVWMSELLVRSALTSLNKPQGFENGYNFVGLQDWNCHRLAHRQGLGADEFSLQSWLTILKEHGNHLAHVHPQLVQGLALGVRAGKTRNRPYVKASCRTTLNDHLIRPHSKISPIAIAITSN